MESPEDLLESLTLISARPEWKASFSPRLRERKGWSRWWVRLWLGLSLLGGGAYAWQQFPDVPAGPGSETLAPSPPEQRSQIFHWIQTDQPEELKKRLAQDRGGLEKTGIRGITPLHYAILMGRFECAGVLLDQGASLETRDPGTTRNVLRDTLSLAPRELIEKLAGRERLDFANPDETLESAWSWLWWKNPDYFQLLLRSRPPLNWQDEVAQGLWKQIATRGNPDLIEQMVNLGAPLDKVSGASPLVLAYRNRNQDAVYRLLSLGADPRAGRPNLLSQAGSASEKKVWAQAADLAACRKHLTLLSIRLEEWAGNHQDLYPKSLEQLPGGRLPSCPSAPGHRFRYRCLGADYELSCPGRHPGLPHGQPHFSPHHGMVPERLRIEPPHL